MTENIYASMGTPLNACWNTFGSVMKDQTRTGSRLDSDGKSCRENYKSG